MPGGALQAFPTQRVWLRGRFNSVKVQLLGYELGKAPQQIQVISHVGSVLLAAASLQSKAVLDGTYCPVHPLLTSGCSGHDATLDSDRVLSY